MKAFIYLRMVEVVLRGIAVLQTVIQGIRMLASWGPAGIGLLIGGAAALGYAISTIFESIKPLDLSGLREEIRNFSETLREGSRFAGEGARAVNLAHAQVNIYARRGADIDQEWVNDIERVLNAWGYETERRQEEIETARQALEAGQ